MTTAELDIDSAQRRADQAAADAQEIRDRIAAGDPTVTASVAAEAELAESFAVRTLRAAQTRQQQRREAEQTAWLEQERADIQAAWTASRDEPAELIAARDAAVAAAGAYLAAYAERQDYLTALNERAANAGFRVDTSPRSTRPSPLPALGRAIVQDSARILDWQWVNPIIDDLRQTVWGA